MSRMLGDISSFERKTRQTLRDAAPITLSGVRANGVIPKVGFLARIHCHVNGTLTVTLGGGTAALDVLGPWNLFQRIRTAINGGKEVFSVSGYGTRIIQDLMARNYVPDDSGLPAAPGHAALVYAAPTAAGANTWDFGFTIPVAPNDDEFLGGFIVQVESAQSSLGFDIVAAPYSLIATQAPVLVTGAATATFTGTVTPLVEAFDIPVNPSEWPPIQALHIYNETEQDPTQVGTQTVDLIKDNVYLQVIHHLVLNAVPASTTFDRLKLPIQRSQIPYDLPARNLLQLQRYRYGRDLPAGVLVHDLFHQGFPNFGNFRDVINAHDLTEFQSILDISSGAVVGTTRKLRTITRMLEPLSEPSARAA